mgnify:CR=1 FL=1
MTNLILFIEEKAEIANIEAELSHLMFWVIKMQEKKICLVIGAGAGIGVNVAKKFATSGYHAVISRRTSQEGLDTAVKSIENEGGDATGFLINAIEENSIDPVMFECPAIPAINRTPPNKCIIAYLNAASLEVFVPFDTITKVEPNAITSQKIKNTIRSFASTVESAPPA